MKIDLKEVLATIINFLILLMILKLLFWNKLKIIISEREKQINDRIDKSKEVLLESEKLKMESEEALKLSRVEGKKITEKRKLQADEIYNEIINNANKVAVEIKEKAKKEIEYDREKIEYKLKLDSVDIAVNLSKEILDKELNQDIQKELIDKFIGGLEGKNV